MNYSSEQINWLRLSRTETIGPVTFHRLLKKFGTASDVLSELPHIFKNKSISIWGEGEATRELEGLYKLGGHMVFAGDSEYPLALSAIEDAPPVLSVLGNTRNLQQRSIALVGARNASLNGRKLAYQIAAELGQKAYVIISGLARGIDTAAHQGSLPYGTVAVLAGGVDVVYPRENQELYQKVISDGGTVISECPLRMQPLAQHFPKRNRIVSGLSEGVVVVEANLRSGSLITARLAAEQGRDVMAVPGFPSDPRSEGTNSLLREGATLVRDATDVVETIESFFKSHSPLRSNITHQLSELEEEFDFLSATSVAITEQSYSDLRNNILAQLSTAPIEINALVRSINAHSAQIQSYLVEMELEGIILRLPGNRVCLKTCH